MHQLALKRPKTIELGQVLSLLSATFKLLTLGASFKRVCLCIAQRFRVIRVVSSWTVLFLRFHQTCSNWWNSFGTFFLFLWTTPRGIDLRTNQSRKKSCNLNLFLASTEFGILVPFVPTLSQINSNLFKKKLLRPRRSFRALFCLFSSFDVLPSSFLLCAHSRSSGADLRRSPRNNESALTLRNVLLHAKRNKGTVLSSGETNDN